MVGEICMKKTQEELEQLNQELFGDRAMSREEYERLCRDIKNGKRISLCINENETMHPDILKKYSIPMKWK